jgi:hypothetical protein
MSEIGTNDPRLVVFCTQTERQDGALRRKMLMESRKSFSKPTEINNTSFFAVRYTTNNCLEGCSVYR